MNKSMQFNIVVGDPGDYAPPEIGDIPSTDSDD